MVKGSLPQFPTGYFDEYLFSILARHHIHTGGTNVLATLSEITGTRFRAPVWGDVSLKRIHLRLPRGVLGSIADIIEKHSTYPYHRIVFANRGGSLGRFAAKHHDYWSMLMPHIGGSRPTQNPSYLPLRFCIQCVLEDLTSVGEPYYHRSHQLPGIDVCYRHGLDLSTSCPDCGATCAHKSIMSLPSLVCVNGHSLLDGQMGTRLVADRSLKEVAQLAHDLLIGGYPSPTLNRLHREIIAEIKNRDLWSPVDPAKEWKNIDADALYEAVVRHWKIPGSLLEQKCAGGYRRNSLRHGLVDTVVHQYAPFWEGPLARVLLIGFLFGDANNYARRVGIRAPRDKYDAPLQNVA